MSWVTEMRSSHGRLRPFHVEHLERLPVTCGSCPLGSGIVPGMDHHGEAASWLRAATHEWGQAGVGYWHEEHIVGYLLLSPPLHVPRVGPQSGFALHPDAAVVMTLRVMDPTEAETVGRQLVQAAAACVARGGGPFRALEVEAVRGHGSCALPDAGFLEGVGFVPCRDHPVRPRLRLDLGRTLRWRPHLGYAMERLTAWARPLPPEPASRTGSEPSPG